jgi:phosphate transport system permease protein
MSKHLGDKLFIHLSRLSALLLIVIFAALVFSLIVMSWPAISHFGFHFLWNSQWNPVTNNFGALSAIVGTLLSSFIALLFAVPISFGIAILITQVLPKRPAEVIGRIVEITAAIPSIIYGMWGLFVMAPFLAKHVQPGLINTFSHIPFLNYIFGGLPIGIGVFSAGIILAIMILPLISSMMRDVLNNVPDLIKEAAYGVGATRYEVVRYVIIHYVRAGLMGGIILGLGRALGETMAVTFVIGNSHQLPPGLFMPGTTISAAIANEFTEATGTLYPAALIELSFVLLIITSITLIISRYLLHRAKTRGGSQ